jgi:hypothetical protein
MIKSKLFIFGTCDIRDIARNELLSRDFDIWFDNKVPTIENGSLDFDSMNPPTSGTSMISLYTKPGAVAQRMLETYETLSRKDRFLYENTVKEIIKYPLLKMLKKNAGPNDYLAISFSSELYTKFLCNSECFTCSPVMHHILDPKNALHWVYKDYLSKEEYLLPFDTKESLEWSFDLLVDFAKDIYEIFQDRVILVKTHFSNLVIEKDLSVVKIKVSPNNLLFYRQTKIVTDPTDHVYAERLSEIIMNKFRHHYPVDLPLIRLDEPVFLDANHRWGLNQFHIDNNSRLKLGALMHESLMKHKNKCLINDEQ